MAKGLLRRLNVLRERVPALPKPDSPAAWVSSAALVLIAFALKPMLDGMVGAPLPPYITFYATVTLAALIGGPRIGLAVSGATVVLVWFFVPAATTFATGARNALALALWLGFSAVQAYLVGRARLALDAMAENEARRDRAARESVHRIKNLIAVVHAIANKLVHETQSVSDYRNLLSSRLRALGSAQDVLVQSDWSDVDLTQILNGALAPFLPNPGLKVEYGPAVVVPARHVSGLSMALYELCTNAMKYGALAEGRGPAVLSWTKQNGLVVLKWREEAPPDADRGQDHGLGTMLIRHALGAEPGCSVEYAIDGRSVRATFCWPAP